MSCKSLLVLGFLAAGGIGPVGVAQALETAIQERALTGDLRGADGADLGRVEALAGPAGWLFRIEGRGWPPGWHGVHLHAIGDCSAPGFQSAGGHLNHAEHSHPHGLLNPGGPELGDLPNVHAGADGSARAELYWAAPVGEFPDLGDTDGTALVVHAARDDHHSQPIGGAGERIACAVLTPPEGGEAG